MRDSYRKSEQTKRLSRRCFLTLCGASSAAAVLSAHTHRSVPSSAVSASASPTPTYTNHVFLPVMSKACSNPCILFQDDFSNGLKISDDPKDWYYLNLQGAKVEIVEDPTNAMDSDGKPRGKVLRCSVTGDSKLEPSGNWVRRGYPMWASTGGFHNSETVRAPAAVQVDVYVPKEMVGNPSSEKPSHSLLSSHVNRIGHQPGQDPDFAFGFSIGRNGSLGYMNSQSKWITLLSNFPADSWHTLRLQVEVNGDVLPFFDSKLVLPEGIKPISIPSGYEVGFGDGHAGLYSVTGSNPTPDFPEGAFLLNDNFRILKYS